VGFRQRARGKLAHFFRTFLTGWWIPAFWRMRKRSSVEKLTQRPEHRLPACGADGHLACRVPVQLQARCLRAPQPRWLCSNRWRAFQQSQEAFYAQGGRGHRPRLQVADPALAVRIHREMFVLKTLPDALCLFHLDLFSRGIQRVISFAAFLCATHVSSGMRQRNSCFR
jgi:hypothetical protein